MGKLIYSMITSLDGFVRDRDGDFGWGAPERETHEFVNEQMKEIGTHLYGRRMYETMVYWETAHQDPANPPFAHAFARTWQSTDKIVYSTTLTEAASERTRIEPAFDPEAVRRLKAGSDLDIAVAGPVLAAQAIRAGLVDEYRLYLGPAIVGGGHPFFPDGVRADLELLDERRFGNGVLYVSYGVRG
ncbi:dihydrofolate reductase family protein [Spirillospora sp. CA-294931]|uniref:dihydrofolate reductase family protein n=1 Tax=Spirillospora sp. CA-294931 TaxID=3240042 RepID=UPI003D929FF1